MTTNRAEQDSVTVVILAGSRDFGRCPIASRLPASLWPVLGQPALVRVIKNLAAQGFREVCVCSEGGVGSFKKLVVEDLGVKLRFLEEPFRAGTAGCIRDAVGSRTKKLIVVVPAAMVSPPDINTIVRAHLRQKADLTAVLSSRRQDLLETSTGIYVCNPTVIGNIPECGYCDIKEWLIPELVRSGKIVKEIDLSPDIGSFRDAPGYMCAVSDYIRRQQCLDAEVSSLRRRDGQNLWVDETAEVDPTAKFFGPVVVMAGALVAKETVVFGPTVIGQNCRIGRNSLVAGSVLWDDARIGANCQLRDCLLDYSVNLANNTIAHNKVIPLKRNSVFVRIPKLLGNSARNLQDFIGRSFAKSRGTSAAAGAVSKTACFAAAVITAAFLWSYWPGIVDLWNVWQRSDEYSSGLLVPFLAAYILWSRRERLKAIHIRPSWWGLAVLLSAEALRLFGQFFMFSSAERLSIVVSITGLVLLLLGWQFFKKTATVMLFLFLMLPWPRRVQAAVSLPLQQWATSSAVFCLETVGYEVIREGNIIHIGDSSVAVAEACNGLRMVTAFFVISGLVVLLAKRPLWQKVIVLASSLPVALLCNTTRLAITAIVFTVVKGEHWEKTFHDFGGYAMMPLALGLIIAELWVLNRLTVLPDKTEPVVITR